MRDLVISAQRIRRERNLFLGCFGLSFLINVAAVVIYDRPWTELFSQIGYVFVVGVCIYLLLWIPRLLAGVLRRLFMPKQ